MSEREPAESAKAGSPVLRIANGVGWTLDTAAVIVAFAAIIAMFLALMADVVVRYMTTRGLGWPAEVPNILFPWLIMGGIVIAAHRGAHIAATLMIDLLPTPAARVLAGAIQCLVIVAFGLLFWLSFKVIAVTGHQVFPITNVPQLYAYSAMTFGFGGIALSGLINLVRVCHAPDPRHLMPPAVEHAT